MRQNTKAYRLAMSVVALMLVPACGAGTSEEVSTDSSAQPLNTTAAESEEPLTFTSWGGVYQDAQVEAFIRPFEEDTGIEVFDDPTLEYAKIQAMVEAGNVSWDVVTVEGFWAVENCNELLLAIDTEIVDLSEIDPDLIQTECAAPLLTYLSAVYYNTHTYAGDDHPVGCDGFFDTETYPGRRAAYAVAVPNALLECALLADGVAADELYPLDTERAFAKIETIRDDLVFWNIGADSEQLMATGEVDVILAFNGRAYAAIAQQDAPFEPAYGESLVHFDVLSVPRGAQNSEAAMRLIASMMDAERQAHLTSLIPYPPANVEAELSGLDETLQRFLPTTNEDLARGTIVQDQRWWAENAEVVSRLWSDTFQG